MLEPQTALDRAGIVEALRLRLRRLECRDGGAGGGLLALRVPEIDAALDGGLALGCVHEVIGSEDDAAAAGFCLALLGRLSRPKPVLWGASGPDGVLYTPGLPAFGLDPARLTFFSGKRDADVLWAMEEALRCPAVAAVAVEVGPVDLTAGRRLQLAAEAGGVTGFLLRRGGARKRGTKDETSGAVTRWRVTAAPSARERLRTSNMRRTPQHTSPSGEVDPIAMRSGRVRGAASGSAPGCLGALPFPSPGAQERADLSRGRGDGLIGAPRWRVELQRCRGGKTGSWLVEWSDETGSFALVATLRDGSAAAGAEEERSRRGLDALVASA